MIFHPTLSIEITGAHDFVWKAQAIDLFCDEILHNYFIFFIFKV